MAVTAEFARGKDFAFHFVAAFAEHLHLNGAVIDEDDVARVDVVDKILIVHIYGALFLAAFAAHGEGKLLAGLQIERYGQLAGADGGSLGVHHNADEALDRNRSSADVAHHPAGPVVRSMGHVQPEDVSPPAN